MLNTPSGRPASWSSSPSITADSGTFSLGFRTNVLPQAIAIGKHPQRHHRREVERRDADADADRMADGFAIDVAGDVLERLAHDQRRHAAGELDHFDAALHATPALRRASCRARA